MGRGASSIPIRQETPEIRSGSPLIYLPPPWWVPGGLIVAMSSNIVVIEQLPGETLSVPEWEAGLEFEPGEFAFFESEEKTFVYRALKKTTAEQPNTHPLAWELISLYKLSGGSFFIAQLDPQFRPLALTEGAPVNSVTIDTDGNVFTALGSASLRITLGSYIVGI